MRRKLVLLQPDELVQQPMAAMPPGPAEEPGNHAVTLTIQPAAIVPQEAAALDKRLRVPPLSPLPHLPHILEPSL